MDLWIYFRFCEGNIYTIRKNETESCLTERGGEWLKHIYEFNRGSFIFSDVLLKKRESEENFAEIVLKSIKNNKISYRCYATKDILEYRYYLKNMFESIIVFRDLEH